jgi:hypothetical protein
MVDLPAGSARRYIVADRVEYADKEEHKIELVMLYITWRSWT